VHFEGLAQSLEVGKWDTAEVITIWTPYYSEMLQNITYRAWQTTWHIELLLRNDSVILWSFLHAPHFRKHLSISVRRWSNEEKSLCHCNFSCPFYQYLSTFKNLMRDKVFTVIYSCKLRTNIVVSGRNLFLQIVHMKNTGLTLKIFGPKINHVNSLFGHIMSNRKTMLGCVWPNSVHMFGWYRPNIMPLFGAT